MIKKRFYKFIYKRISQFDFIGKKWFLIEKKDIPKLFTNDTSIPFFNLPNMIFFFTKNGFFFLYLIL